MLTRLWCAGILCPHLELKRFHFTCLYCRWRRKHVGKWTVPPYWIDYTLLWAVERYAVFNRQGKLVAFQDRWQAVKIDPRGHFTMLRCASIVLMDKVMKRFRWTRKPLMEFAEFLANYPTF